jgi:uncharacterized membrane protein
MMADSTTAVYAIVDISKKQRSNSITEDEVVLPRLDSPVYDMAEIPPPLPERSEIDSEYSVITLDNICYQATIIEQGKEAETTIEGPSQTSNADQQMAGGSGCKVFTCIFITIVIVAVITLICLTILFAEVSKLRTQDATTAQSTINQLLKDDLSSIRCQLTQLSSSVQTQLNVSVDRLNKQLVTELYLQLNRSLNSQQASLLALNSSIQMELSQYSDSLDELQLLHPGQTQALPVSLCAALKDLPQSLPSGYYWVRASNGSAVRVYCDMTRSCGGVTGGWMRVAELDMTNSSHQCPNHLTETTSSSRHTCIINSSSAACSPAIAYSTVLEYSKVCGRIRAFKTGNPDGFIPLWSS